MSEILQQLKKSEENGKLAHAYLFYSASENDLSDLVNDVLKNVLQMDKNKESINFKRIGIEEGESEIKIEKIRDVIKFLSLSSYDNSYKAVLIKNAEKLNKNSANALLKILEEPSQKKIIILTAANKNAVLPTILSRVQAIGLFTKKQKYVNKSGKDTLSIKELISADLSERFILAEKLAKDEKVENALLELQEAFHSAMYIGFEAKELADDSFKESSEDIAKRYSLKDIGEKLKLIGEAINLASTTNTQKKLLLENLFLSL